MAISTWAPRGETPILKVKLTRDHLSAMSGITLDGKLFMQVRKSSYDAEAVIDFLKGLHRQIKGKILIVWDGSPIHRNKKIQAFLSAGAAKWLHFEQFPGYAPDLNPAEGIWQYLKRVELGNLCCTDLDQLATELIRAKERLRHKRDIIKACSLQCGYAV
jgi:transposase